MPTLATRYLGLALKNPLIAASSPLTANIDSLKRLEDAGVAAVVLKSIFEEQIESIGEASAAQAAAYSSHTDGYEFLREVSKQQHIDAYLALVEEAKASLDIPVIASINCRSNGKWIEYARRFVAMGADAIELNHYVVASDPEISGKKIEDEYRSLVKHARKALDLPLSLKMSSSFSSLAHMLRTLDKEKIDGVVLFNRFYNPDINLKTMQMVQAPMLSSPEEYTLSLRWTALMSQQVRYDICANTGIWDAATIIKQLLAGAASVQLCSVLLKKGLGVIEEMLGEIGIWMEEQGHASIDAFKGTLSEEHSDPMTWDRVQYVRSLLDADAKRG